LINKIELRKSQSKGPTQKLLNPGRNKIKLQTLPPATAKSEHVTNLLF